MRTPLNLSNGSHILLALSAAATCLIGFQNCGGMYAADFGPMNSSALSSTITSMSACLLDETYDACVIPKGSATSPNDPTEIGNSPALGVDLSWMTRDGRLENENFVVVSQPTSTQARLSEALPASQRKFRFPLSDADGLLKNAMVTSFYWANVALSKAHEAAQVSAPSAGRKIKLVLSPSSSGWAPAKNQIHLGGDGLDSMALDPSIVVYFVGWANIDYATGGKIHQANQSKNVECGGKVSCCANANGCARALASGHAEYLVALTFPTNTAVGDRKSNSPLGMPICGTNFYRNPKSLVGVSVATAGELCSSIGQANEIYALGSIYASIWWSVRELDESDDMELDRLHMKLISQLNGDDDFLTALEKLKTLDQAEFGSAFSRLFEAEYRTRGLL